MIDVDAEVRRYVGDRPPAAWAWMRDPQYRAQMEMLRQLANLVEGAMRDEGIPEWIRLRVLRRTLFGSPDPDEAVVRVRQHEQLVHMASTHPAATPVSMSLADLAADYQQLTGQPWPINERR